MIYLLIAIFLIGAIIIIFLLFSIYYTLATKVPWAKTPDQNIKIIFDHIDLPKNSLVYDLGCGDGRVLFEAEKRGYQAMGYELSWYPYLKALLKKFFLKSSAQIKRKNYFNEDIGDASLVFAFLVKAVMKKTQEKLKKELKKEAIVVSYGFEFPDLKSEKKIKTRPSEIYFYKI